MSSELPKKAAEPFSIEPSGDGWKIVPIAADQGPHEGCRAVVNCTITDPADAAPFINRLFEAARESPDDKGGCDHITIKSSDGTVANFAAGDVTASVAGIITFSKSVTLYAVPGFQIGFMIG